MELHVTRNERIKSVTIGDFYINGEAFCYSLEDKDRQWDNGIIIPWVKDLKVPGETAIPYGKYEVRTDYSVRFTRVMPIIINVPDFTGIRIHNGSTDKDTQGCILIGFKKNTNIIWQSKIAFAQFFLKLETALNDGEKVTIDIT